MPFGQGENIIYSPVRAEYLTGGNIAGWQNNYLSALVRLCRAKRAAKNTFFLRSLRLCER